MSDLPYLPDLVTDKILQLLQTKKILPTKAAVHVSFLSKQWQGVLSSVPVLNFDEDDDFERHDLDLYSDYLHQHNKFINFLNGYLKYREKYDQTALLDKLRLHVTMYFSEDATTIHRWLEFAFERGVKELDLSGKIIDPKEYLLSSEESDNDPCLYDLPWAPFVNAKSLTTLNLENIIVTNIERADNPDIQCEERLLPSLKNMSFTTVLFDDKSLFSLLLECPSVEYLSLNGCWFEKFLCHISSSSLKSLEVKYCQRLKVLLVEDNAMKLESFTFVSLPPPNSKCEKVILADCCNLKIINISVDDLEELAILGSHRAVEATINTQTLHSFKFMGYSKAKVSVKACESANVMIQEVWEEKCILSSSTHFTSLWSFLKRFECCKDIFLCIQDFKALIFPQSFRMTFPSPLPKLSILQVSIKNPPTETSRDSLKLMGTLSWLAPSANITTRRLEITEQF